MKIKIFFILFLFCTADQISAQEAYRQNLANIASIDFPSKPMVKDTLGQQVYHAKDLYGTYLVVAMDMSKEAGFELKSADLNEFYKGNINGILETAKGELISEKPIEIDGLKGMDVVYKSSSNPNLPDLRFKRILFLNGIILSIDFWTLSANERATKPQREKFFNSMMIIADKASLKQSNSSPAGVTASNIGYHIGKALGYLSVVGVILIVITYLRRRAKKT